MFAAAVARTFAGVEELSKANGLRVDGLNINQYQ